MKAKPIFKDIKGAPFKINTKVKIVSVSDETGNKKLLGKTGKVIYFEYSCGCGQHFPNDPMIGVLFKNGKTEEFWREELKCL